METSVILDSMYRGKNMYYIEQIEDELVKYEVKIDQEQLEKIKIEIINNCSEIIHIKEIGNRPTNEIHDTLHIRDFKRKFLYKKEYNDFYMPDEDIYEFDYYEYKDTTLVNLINRLLARNTNVILNLKNPEENNQLNDKNQNLEEKIKKLLSNIDKVSPQQLEELNQQLESYLEYKELNSDRKSDLGYYSEVLECITLEEQDRIKIDKLEQFNHLYQEVESFFTATSSRNIHPNISKELYKRLIIK